MTMDYFLDMIETTAACEALIDTAMGERRKIAHRRDRLGDDVRRYQEIIEKLAQEMADVNILLVSLKAGHERLTGNHKIYINVDKEQTETRKAELEKAQLTYNVASLLGKQLAYNLMEQQVIVYDTYLSGLRNRKNELETAEADKE